MSFFWQKKKNEDKQLARRPAPDGINDGNESVVAGTLNTTPWDPVSELPYPGLDLAMLHAGSIAKTAVEYVKAVQVQAIANCNLATDTLAVPTPEDLVVIKEGLWTPDESVVLAVRQGSETFAEHHPGRAVVIDGLWKTLGNHVGCGCDPDFGMHILQTDPMATQSLDVLVERTLAQLRRHNLTGGCAVMEHIGAGGSYVLGEYIMQDFAQSMEVNRRHRVLYLGSQHQYLNRRIARRWLAEFLADPIPDNTLLYLVSLDKPGKQGWDLTLAHGLVTVSATDRYFGQGDAYNHFRKLKERGNIVEVKAHIVPMPLRRLEKRTWFGRTDVYYVIQDSPVPALLSALARELAVEGYRYRLVVFTGDFRDDEIEQLQQRPLGMAPWGTLEVLVNRMMPVTHNRERADYYMVAFRIPEGQPPALLDLASDDGPLPGGDWDRGQLLDRLAQGNGSHDVSIPEAVRGLFGSRR